MAYAYQPPTNPPEPCKRRAVSLPRASGCCLFGQVTFAGMDRNGRDAPKADLSLQAEFARLDPVDCAARKLFRVQRG